MSSDSFQIGETVVVDEDEVATILQLYSLRAKNSNRVHDMVRVRTREGEIREYFLVDLGRIMQSSNLFDQPTYD